MLSDEKKKRTLKYAVDLKSGQYSCAIYFHGIEWTSKTTVIPLIIMQNSHKPHQQNHQSPRHFIGTGIHKPATVFVHCLAVDNNFSRLPWSLNLSDNILFYIVIVFYLIPSIIYCTMSCIVHCCCFFKICLLKVCNVFIHLRAG